MNKVLRPDGKFINHEELVTAMEKALCYAINEVRKKDPTLSQISWFNYNVK